MQQSLEDNLVMRTLRDEQDLEQLAHFNERIHHDANDPPDGLAIWTRYLLNNNPVMSYENVLVVEDASTGQIISTLCVIPQIWQYDGIEFQVGRIELVGTDEKYRNRGLIRRQFEAIHQRCADLNINVQSITGIYYYYRMFGYEYALDLGGGYSTDLQRMHKTPENTPFDLRPARLEDISQMNVLHQQMCDNYLVSVPRTPEIWQYLVETPVNHVYESEYYVITRDDSIVGYVNIAPQPSSHFLRVRELALNGDYYGTTRWLLQRLRNEAHQRFPEHDPTVIGVYFHLGPWHPLYDFLEPYRPTFNKPYAWYVRVADTAAFIQQIAPVLEKRIADSPIAGLTETLTFDFYRSGLVLDFENGRLIDADNLPMDVDGAQIGFPQGVFWKLVFGYRSLNDLRNNYPDSFCQNTMVPIVNTLFPRQPSWGNTPLY